MTASGIEAGLFDADDLPYPVMPEKKERRVEKKTVFLIHHHSMTAIIKRPDTGLLAGMYEFPSMDGFVSLKASAEFVRSLGFEPVRILPLEEVKHIFTHKEWHMRGFNVVTAETADSSSNVSDTILLRTTRSILADYPVPSAYRAYLEHLEDL